MFRHTEDLEGDDMSSTGWTREPVGWVARRLLSLFLAVTALGLGGGTPTLAFVVAPDRIELIQGATSGESSVGWEVYRDGWLVGWGFDGDSDSQNFTGDGSALTPTSARGAGGSAHTSASAQAHVTDTGIEFGATASVGGSGSVGGAYPNGTITTAHMIAGAGAYVGGVENGTYRDYVTLVIDQEDLAGMRAPCKLTVTASVSASSPTSLPNGALVDCSSALTVLQPRLTVPHDLAEEMAATSHPATPWQGEIHTQSEFRIDVSAYSGVQIIASAGQGGFFYPQSVSLSCEAGASLQIAISPTDGVKSLVPGAFPEYKQPASLPGSCASTSAAMVIDYWASKDAYSVYARDPEDPTDTAERRITELYTSIGSPESANTIAEGINRWFWLHSPWDAPLLGAVRVPSSALDYSSQLEDGVPVMLLLQRKRNANPLDDIGHVVAAYGQYVIAGTDHAWLAVMDTWSDGLGGLSDWEKLDNHTATWTGYEGADLVEWWPVPGSMAALLEPSNPDETGYVDAGAVIVIVPIGRLSVLSLRPDILPEPARGFNAVSLMDGMSRSDWELAGTECDYTVTKSHPDSQANFQYVPELESDALRLFSPDGSPIGISTLLVLPDVLGVYFGYIALTDGKLGLYVDDILLDEILLSAGSSEPMYFLGSYPMEPFGLVPGRFGEFKIVLSAVGDPEVYIDNLILGEAIPEPASVATLLTGLCALLVRRRRRSRTAPGNKKGAWHP